MWNVANTLYEEITQEMIQHANLQRNSVNLDNKKKESVMISDHWKEELKSLPMSISVSINFITNIYVQKKGKMVALLKQKSKVTIQHKPRKTYEIKNMFKRAKIDEDLTQEQRDQAAKALGLSETGKTSRRNIRPTVIERFDVEIKDQETKH